MKSLALLTIPLLLAACSSSAPQFVERKFVEVYVPDEARWTDVVELARAQAPRTRPASGVVWLSGTSDPVRYRLALDDGDVVTVAQPCFEMLEAGDRWPSDARVCEQPAP